MNSMNHVSGSLHLEGTVLHTVIMNVLHAEFHQEMLKRRRAQKQHAGGYSAWVVPIPLLKQAGMGGTVGSTDSSARHHLREGRKYRTADVLYKGHFLATNLLLRSQLVKTGQNCSSQSLSQASPLCNLGELLCSFFLSQVHRTVKHLHLQNKTC